MPEKTITICENYGVDVWVPVEYWKVVRWFLSITWDPSKTTINKWALYIKWTEDWAGGGELELVVNDVKVYRNSASGWPPGPCGSMMAGILLFGLSDRNSGLNWSFASKRTRCGS